MFPYCERPYAFYHAVNFLSRRKIERSLLFRKAGNLEVQGSYMLEAARPRRKLCHILSNVQKDFHDKRKIYTSPFDRMKSKILLLLCFFETCFAGPDEKRLIETLLHDYNPIERPVANEWETVPLKFGI